MPASHSLPSPQPSDGSVPTLSQPQSPFSSLPRLLRSLINIGVIVMLISALIAVGGNWLAGWHLTRLWLQCSAVFIGALLLLAAFILRSHSWLRRLILVIGGVLFLCAVLDSLDGQQDWLPMVVILLTVWALEYAYTCLYLLDMQQPSTRRRWFAIYLGGLASCVYLGAALYYEIVHITLAPVQIDHHPLFGAGIVIATLLNWLGEIGFYNQSLTGKVRICSSCELRNIPERTRCKRCRSPLGSIEVRV